MMMSWIPFQFSSLVHMQDSVDIKMLIEVRGPEYVENIFALSQYSLVTGFLIGMREIILHIFQA